MSHVVLLHFPVSCRGADDGTGAKWYLIDKQLPYGQVVAEYGNSGSLTAAYVYGLERISQERDGEVRFYLADGQGSVRALTDASGNVTDKYWYTAFGEELAKTGSTPNEFRYTGEQWDPNAGFYYLRARWYRPEDGRFTSVDPWAGDLQAPVSLHRYLYGYADPVNRCDPSGLTPNLQIYINALKRFLPNWLWVANRFGTWVHEQIVRDVQRHYFSAVGPFVPIPNGQGGYDFADLLIPPYDIYEFKPIGLAYKANNEITEYVAMANRAGLPYRPGILAIGGTVKYPDGIPMLISYWTTMPGLIVYIPMPDPITLAGAMAMYRIRSIQLQISFIVSQLALRRF